MFARRNQDSSNCLHSSPINSEILKAKDVKQADRPAASFIFRRRSPIDGGIDFIHYPHKQPPVDSLMETKTIQLVFVANSIEVRIKTI